MKEALFYKTLKDKNVKCELCPHFCIIENNCTGKCGVRKNIEGKLFSLVYGLLCSTTIDPIEKKPLFHFLPGSKTFSVGTVGCNLKCKQCQNFETAQSEKIIGEELKPELVIAKAIKNNCESIAYTYNEPTVFYEYALETAELAHQAGIKNVLVTNAFINLEPIEKLYPFIDAVNIDLKSFDEKFYNEVCIARLKPVLQAIKKIKEYCLIEITNLIIPGLNDDLNQIEDMCKWISENLGKDTPLHFSRFFPQNKLTHIYPTPEETLLKAKEIADKYLYYVYIGNIDLNEESTYCPRCKEELIKRLKFEIIENKINENKCPHCKLTIKGVFE